MRISKRLTQASAVAVIAALLGFGAMSPAAASSAPPTGTADSPITADTAVPTGAAGLNGAASTGAAPAAPQLGYMNGMLHGADGTALDGQITVYDLDGHSMGTVYAQSGFWSFGQIPYGEYKVVAGVLPNVAADSPSVVWYDRANSFETAKTIVVPSSIDGFVWLNLNYADAGHYLGYVSSLYNDYLGRAPSASEQSGWTEKLWLGSPRSIVSNGFVNSDEYRLIRIDAAYRDVLGRTSDAGGRLNWLNAMRGGAITTDDISTSFYASAEYYGSHGGTNTSYAAALYTALLGRAGSSSDYAFWAALVSQNGRAWVIDQFWDSTETINKRVSAMYASYLGRTPDPGGLKSWVGVALRIGDSGLRSGFTTSDEYWERAFNRFGGYYPS